MKRQPALVMGAPKVPPAGGNFGDQFASISSHLSPHQRAGLPNDETLAQRAVCVNPIGMDMIDQQLIQKPPRCAGRASQTLDLWIANRKFGELPAIIRSNEQQTIFVGPKCRMIGKHARRLI